MQNNYETNRAVRTKMLIGESGWQTLQNKRVLVCGLGGVGGIVVEALARSGIGYLRIVDHDTVSESNANRQLIADSTTIGQKKADLWFARLKAIAPSLKIDARSVFFAEDNSAELLKDIDAVVDCIDSVGAKIHLIREAKKRGLLLISSMGAANKTDPRRLFVSTLDKTHTCPLARRIRQALAKEKLGKIAVVFSDEIASCPYPNPTEKKGNAPAPASMMIVPASFGLLCADYIIKNLLKSTS